MSLRGFPPGTVLFRLHCAPRAGGAGAQAQPWARGGGLAETVCYRMSKPMSCSVSPPMASNPVTANQQGKSFPKSTVYNLQAQPSAKQGNSVPVVFCFFPEGKLTVSTECVHPPTGGQCAHRASNGDSKAAREAPRRTEAAWARLPGPESPWQWGSRAPSPSLRRQRRSENPVWSALLTAARAQSQNEPESQQGLRVDRRGCPQRPRPAATAPPGHRCLPGPRPPPGRSPSEAPSLEASLEGHESQLGFSWPPSLGPSDLGLFPKVRLAPRIPQESPPRKLREGRRAQHRGRGFQTRAEAGGWGWGGRSLPPATREARAGACLP